MAYHKHLSKDKVLKKLIKEQGLHSLQLRQNILLRLCGSILGQQLSTKVAAVIRNRFMELFNGKKPTAQKILDIPHDTLRSIGLSNAKAIYIKNVCHFFIEHKLTDAKLHRLTNEAFIEFITQIKGVGKWTAEMLLMFSLGREDVFSIGDLGLQKAVSRLYDIRYTDKKTFEADVLSITEAWKPYRTYACLHLWQYLDATPD
ncbi:DNA-3-methyladenine glycosylase family protein [Niabella drilacis]|uniref:DNA-3-methyladenine glycosylase II n=1 Tax=Niabella drilacis (strain DSM 25811 / CCM 8410 / CCUG 62505 / LMG 26954 / E90) TaxID=1285928 RepID=A0A1G6W9F8_NIADE|nr:DNA-3-methyladenine glycosylase [Niabella drilacis]SDD61695.1 DNA-3-methyladenine glycosylase II [Niabella drilacis]